MSMATTEKICCPACNREQTVTVWSSINVTLDPTLRTQLFDGQINQFECEVCGHKAFLNSPLLYHDMGRGFCVQYYPPQAIEDEDFIENFKPSDPPQLKGMPTKMGEYLIRPHLVFDMNDLLYCVMFYEKLLSAGE